MSEDIFAGKSDEEVYASLVANPWGIIRSESKYDDLPESKKAEMLRLAKTAELPPHCKQHQGWLRRAGLIWFRNQFYNGGVWQPCRNMQCWDVAMEFLLGTLELVKATETAKYWRNTIAIWKNELSDDERAHFLSPMPIPVSMKLDHHLMEMSDVLFGKGNAAPKEDLLKLAESLPQW